MVKIKLTPEHRGQNSTTFTGNPQGKEVRKLLELSRYDRSGEEVVIVIPKGTTSFNPSFYSGLLYDSIVFYKGIENFKRKYSFEYEDDGTEIAELLKENIADDERLTANEYQRFN